MIKIFFKNGAVMEGKIRKFSKKKMVVKTKAGDKLIIFNPHEVIMMIMKIKKPKEKIESFKEEPNYNEQEVIVDQIWEHTSDKYFYKKWKVVDVINENVTLENTNHTININKNELNFKNYWVLIYSPVITKEPVFDLDDIPLPPFVDQMIETIESKPIEDIDLRSKKLAELHLLKKKIDLESIGKKIKTFMPDQPKVTVYDLPNFTKSSATNDSSKKNS